MKQPNLELRFGASVDPQLDDVIADNTRAYNNQFVSNAYEPCSVYVFDHSNELIGGLTAKLFWHWMHIDYLWVKQQHRTEGLGSAILAKAEQFARQRQCVGVMLDTFSFQAQAFYQKNGFSQFGVLNDYEGGHQRFYLQKALIG